MRSCLWTLFLAPSILAMQNFNIMPIGDSLTQWACGLIEPNTTLYSMGGFRSFLGNSIRAFLSPNASFSFVGSQYDCGSHQGYSGITALGLQGLVERAMVAHQPDIVLLQAGTNDLFNNQAGGNGQGANSSVTAGRIQQLISTTLAVLPKARILLTGPTTINATRCANFSSAPWHPVDCPLNMTAELRALNALLPAVADAFPQGAVTFHDPAWDVEFVEADWWFWGIHFTESGFAKLAAAKWKYLQGVLQSALAQQNGAGRGGGRG
jgi:lysophospholipase L1-like esterase